ncbi:neurturin-like isoform X1 [Mobula birostris]|uniref:neurturin-like isoform X1 n=1 Tax=Mobula birostris TaxID=1983395 RepID=UPI003B280689
MLLSEDRDQTCSYATAEHETGASTLRRSDRDPDGEFIISPSPSSVSSLEASDPQPYAGRSRRKRKMSVTRKGEAWEERSCRLRALQLRVQDLGLGYRSDEIILFKYCSGSCPLARTNHDLTLSLLLRKADFLNLSREKIVSDPCCRPTQFKDVSFLDNQNRWHRVEKLSASECSCIG